MTDSGLPQVLTADHLQPLVRLLPQLLDKNEGPRKAAEQQLLQLEKIPGFCMLLLVRSFFSLPFSALFLAIPASSVRKPCFRVHSSVLEVSIDQGSLESRVLVPALFLVLLHPIYLAEY